MSGHGQRRAAKRAVLLDALGTLVELQAPAPRLRIELRRRLDLSVTEAQARRAIQAEMAYYRAHLDEGRDEPSLAQLRRRCAEVLWHQLPLTAGPPPPGRVLVETLMAALSFRAFDDAPAALALLKARGLRLVVVSNWDVSLPGVLDAVGLAGWLDGVVTSAQVGARKPERAIFERALEVAGVNADEALHVGDSLREDVTGARAAGVAAVLLARGEPRATLPGRQVDDAPRIATLRDLPALVQGGQV